MKIEQKGWTKEGGWKQYSTESLPGVPQLVLVFGASALVKEPATFDDVKKNYPSSHIVMMSTAGEILDTTVSDGTLSLMAIYFEKTTVQLFEADIQEASQSKAVGEQLGGQLPQEKLAHVMVFSDGLKVNGTAFIEGMAAKLPKGMGLTGGLVGDGADLKHTFVGLDHVPQEGKVVVVGFYGEALEVSFGSMGGWDVFGPERIVTRSKDNVLFELDGKPALALYKEYLGEEKSKQLPSSGLSFPFNMKVPGPEGEAQVVRTLLGIDEHEQGLVLAGDIPEGRTVQLMKANFERLVNGASQAAGLVKKDADLAILISCVGRKLILQDRIEEETEAIREVFGPHTVLTGFYSYGEISPGTPTARQCQLHNQTMTITTFTEK
jgi:hypothetical protein